VVSFTTRPLYPRGRNSRYPLDRRLGGPQNRSERRAKEKILDPTGTRIPPHRSSSSKPVGHLIRRNLSSTSVVITYVFVIHRSNALICCYFVVMFRDFFLLSVLCPPRKYYGRNPHARENPLSGISVFPVMVIMKKCSSEVNFPLNMRIKTKVEAAYVQRSQNFFLLALQPPWALASAFFSASWPFYRR
jgi:hypothetical protein